jgi:hypothetical protein
MIPGWIPWWHPPWNAVLKKMQDLPRPQDIDRGVKLAYASLLFGIVTDAVDFRHFLALGNLATSVITYGLLVFLIMKVSTGRNWARIVLLLMFLFGIALLLTMFLVGLYPKFLPDAWKRNPMMILVAVVPALLQGAALFFWFTRSSGEWFKSAISA